MDLFHGSRVIVKTPQYGIGALHNDYGQGFYCTKDEELAKEWACQEGIGGFCNRYSLDTDGLSIVDLNCKDYHVLNWIALLVQNRTFSRKTAIAQSSADYILRNFLPDISKADIVRGYRADDSYFAYAKDFLNNTITVHQLSEAMRLGELGEQVVLKSKKAFQRIMFVGADPVQYPIYGLRREERDSRARDAYLDSHGTDFALSPEDLYMADIMRRRMTNADGSVFRGLS